MGGEDEDEGGIGVVDDGMVEAIIDGSLARVERSDGRVYAWDTQFGPARWIVGVHYVGYPIQQECTSVTRMSTATLSMKQADYQVFKSVLTV